MLNLLICSTQNTLSGLSKKRKLKIWFFKELQVSLCIIRPQVFVRYERIIWATWRRLVTEPLCCTKTPRSHTESSLSFIISRCHLTEGFFAVHNVPRPLTTPPWKGLISGGKCIPGGRWLPRELIKSGQIS